MDTVKRQFYDAIRREGKIIKKHYTNQEFNCFMRTFKDVNNMTDHMFIYYDIGCNIKQGQLIDYGGETYLLLNQESVGNNVYFKSSIVQCNIKIPVLKNGKYIYIPAYVDNITSTINDGKIISIIDGKGLIRTEITNQFKINDELRVLGGTYKIANYHELHGMTNISIERTLSDHDKYEMLVTLSTNDYTIGKSVQMEVNTMVNAIPFDNPTITYSSSDTTIATIDNNGLIQLLAKGTVNITVNWMEENLSKTIELEVAQNEEEILNKITFNKSSIWLNWDSSIIPTMLNNNGDVITEWIAEWEVDYNGNNTNDFNISYNGNILNISVSENYNLVGQTIILTCYDSANRNIMKQQAIKITL